MEVKKTALLVFTRTAANEAKHKNLLGEGSSKIQNLVIAKQLIAKTKCIAAQSGLDVIVCTDFNQKGNTFGKRLSNAIEETFSKGYHSVIAIGSDTPALTVSHINEATQSLQNQNVVLGPSTDGGVYLIGINRNAFNRNSFENLPWLSSSVYYAFALELNKSGHSVTTLQSLSDIDDIQGLFAAIGELGQTDEIKRLALQFLYSSPQLSTAHKLLPSLYNGLPNSLRAPPFS